MVVKWPLEPIIDQGPISRLWPKLTPHILWQPERMWHAEGSESKRAWKNERKGANKKFGTRNLEEIWKGNRKKKLGRALRDLCRCGEVAVLERLK